MPPRPPEPFPRDVRLREIPDGAGGFPWTLPAVQALHAEPLRLHPRCTFLVGANGSGKSTLLEGIAVAAGLGVQGGGSGFRAAGREDELALGDALTLTRGARRPRTDFFLRAESMLGFADSLDRMREGPGGATALDPYGGVSLHEQSHGESFLAVITHRFGPNGLYLLDEPESALSPQSLLALVARIDDLAGDGCQFIIATHAPILLALPGAEIVEITAAGLERVSYDEVEAVRLTRLVPGRSRGDDAAAPRGLSGLRAGRDGRCRDAAQTRSRNQPAMPSASCGACSARAPSPRSLRIASDTTSIVTPWSGRPTISIASPAPMSPSSRIRR